MALAPKEVFVDTHLRKNADYVLQSNDRLLRDLDAASLPIPGLRSRALTEKSSGGGVEFREVLNPAYRPVVIFDLDNTVWPHTRDLLKAISHVARIGADDEDLKVYGHTRRIPQWMTPEIDAIQDAIQANRHPDVNPFVNVAHKSAVETLHAVHAMGHLYTYLTGRMVEMYATTKRVIEWNGLPFDQLAENVDARNHPEPKLGYLYCSPVDPKQVNEYKNTVVNMWLQNLRSAGWRGRMILVDDTPKAFREEIERGDMAAIVLHGSLNHALAPLKKEQRVESWDDIALLLQRYHSEAVASDPAPVRVFQGENGGSDVTITVDKQAAGNGYFTLEQLSQADYTFVRNSTLM